MKAKLTAFIFAFCFVVISRGQMRSAMNIQYTGTDTLQRLDVFWNSELKNCPVLVFVHGGGFLSGNKADYREMARVIAQQAITVVLVNYRLSPHVKYPLHHQDVAAAIAWVDRNIGGYSGSRKKINLMGHSAGGHIVTRLVVNNDFLDRHHIRTSDIKSVIVASGVFEIQTQEGGATPRYLGMVFGNDPRVWELASCQYHLENTRKLPSFLLSWCAEENSLIINESTSFSDALRRRNHDVQTYVFPGGDHNSFQDDLANVDSEFYKRFHEMISVIRKKR